MIGKSCANAHRHRLGDLELLEGASSPEKRMTQEPDHDGVTDESEELSVQNLMRLAEKELRSLAGYYMARERRQVTLQATALVNEAFVRLAEDKKTRWESRTQFVRIAAGAMRRILVDYARRRLANKRGSGQVLCTLGEADQSPAKNVSATELLALDEALRKLGNRSPRQASVVELRYFGGLTVPETAKTLGIARSTVDSDWSIARMWLRRELEEGVDP